MWQRKQTIYLALVVILMIGAMALLYPFSDNGERTQSVTVLLIAIQSLTSIFAYENRKAQMRKCIVGMLLCVISVAYFGITYWWELDAASPLPFYPCLPLISIVLFWLAYKGVKHDDDLVRSADRIR